MKIKFKRNIRLLVRLDCYEDLWDNEQEWEFDQGEELEVYDIIMGEPRKLRHGKKKRTMYFADIFLKQGRTEQWPDYIHMVPEDCFEIID